MGGGDPRYVDLVDGGFLYAPVSTAHARLALAEREPWLHPPEFGAGVLERCRAIDRRTAGVKLTGMFHRLRPTRRVRSRLLLLAAFVALVGQGVGALVAPIVEGHTAAGPPAHAESGGTHQHKQITHNPDTCPACAALQLTGLPQRAARPTVHVHGRYAPRSPQAEHVAPASGRFAPKAPRAPPAPRASVA